MYGKSLSLHSSPLHASCCLYSVYSPLPYLLPWTPGVHTGHGLCLVALYIVLVWTGDSYAAEWNGDQWYSNSLECTSNLMTITPYHVRLEALYMHVHVYMHVLMHS